MTPKIACICPTRGRFRSLRESISFFLLQDYPNKELIIFNNHPTDLIPHPKLAKHNIKVINGGDYSGRSMQTIYAETLKHVSEDAEYIAIWDDDDMYLPWHLSENMSKLLASGKEAIRPRFGYWQDTAHSVEYNILSNTFEAGIIAKKNLVVFDETVEVNTPGYTHPHIFWDSKASQEGKYTLNHDITAIFRWHYGLDAHHLQSVGPHRNSEDGENEILRPVAVRHRFMHFLEDVFLVPRNDLLSSFTQEEKKALIDKVLSYDIDMFEHVDKWKAWIYWNANPPRFIQECHNSIRENTFAEVEVVTDETLIKYDIPQEVYNLHPVQRSDYLRIFFLEKYGGWWFDSDTYVVGDLDKHYFRFLQTHETTFPLEYNVPGNMTTPLFGSRQKGTIIREALNNIRAYLKTDPQIGWSGIGVNGIIKAVNQWKNVGDGIFFGLPNIATFGYNNNQIRSWNFLKLNPSELNMIIFHWSQVGAELSWHIGLDSDGSLDKIVEHYPNMQPLFDFKYKVY